MNRSFRIARIAGINLNIHPTFLLMLPLGALLWSSSAPGLTGALFGMLMIILLFACVLLHELGHALTARALEIPVREIQLLPFGGVAVLGRPVLNPGHELLIALMGPIINVLIVLFLAVLAIATGLFDRLNTETAIGIVGDVSFDGALLWLIQANMLLALFNMIPAFPLDGGRTLRALLAFAISFRRATVISAAIGQGIAVLLAIWGLFSLNFLLIVTAVFIFFAARQEVAATEAVGILDGMRVTDALAPAPTLEVGQRIRDAAELMKRERLSAAIVMQGERPLGMVVRPDVDLALATGRGDMWITLITRRELTPVDADASLEAARRLMAEQNTPVVAAYDGDTFRGLLSIDDIAAAYARRNGQQPPQAPATPEASPSA